MKYSATPARYGRQFERSRRRFYRKQYGFLGTILAGVPRARTLPMPSREQASLEGEAAVWLASPTPWGLPAALWTGPSQGPAAVAEAFRDTFRHTREVTVLAVAEDHDEVQGIWRFEPG